MSKSKEYAPYNLVTPCDNCPFRKDIPPYLTKTRVREIERSLVLAEFPCHKTTKFDEDGEYLRSNKERHCAGALILLEKLNRPSQMMRIAERIGLYNRSKLNMKAPIFDSFKHMQKAEPN